MTGMPALVLIHIFDFYRYVACIVLFIITQDLKYGADFDDWADNQSWGNETCRTALLGDFVLKICETDAVCRNDDDLTLCLVKEL